MESGGEAFERIAREGKGGSGGGARVRSLRGWNDDGEGGLLEAIRGRRENILMRAPAKFGREESVIEWAVYSSSVRDVYDAMKTSKADLLDF